MKNHIIYYAGPAKTPAGYASGSFGPTTAGRMDSYVDKFMEVRVRVRVWVRRGHGVVKAGAEEA